LPGGQAFAGGAAVPGDRTLALRIADERARRLREFFTFRKPQPDYFQGPTEPDMWSWLEVYPQHVFRNARGEKEQMAVGVAQNAVGGRLGSMSEPGARGRSFRGGATDPAPGAVLRGLNFAEQFERALAEDPRFIFITGWNEWVAGRHAEFSGVRLPVMFVDQFDQEHSRDIEPMRGGHGDNYYYQMVSFVRRFKGARPLPRPSAPATIRIDGGFAQWADVEPEFRDDIGDTAHRDHPGYNDCARYVNRSGRNDIVACKVARDAENLYFYARTRAPLTPAADARWMLLLIDVDCDHRTGWEGYDFLVGRTSTGATTSLERNAGGWAWEPVAAVALAAHASGAMDVSDGLVGDLTKMLRVSGATALVDVARIPLSPAARDLIAARPELLETALTGGDDYEILASVPSAKASLFEAAASVAGIPVTRIGEVAAGQGAPQFRDIGGEPMSFRRGSFSHF